MRTLRRTWLFGLLGLVAVACSDGPSRLRDGSAASLLESQHSELIVIGAVRFWLKNVVDPGAGGAPVADYKLYSALAEKGFLEISDNRDLTSGFTGWDDFFSLTQQGVRRTARVDLTPAGSKIGKVLELNGGRCVQFRGCPGRC